MAELFDACAASFGKTVARASLLAVMVGVAAFAVGCLVDLSGVVLGTLAASWLFFAGLATGAVALSAAVRSSRGAWALSALPYAEAGVGFFPVAFVLLAGLVLAASAWMPGVTAIGSAEWISRVVRDLAATAILFAAGRRYLRGTAGSTTVPRAPTVAAVTYLLIFVATLSLWAVDLVMALHDWAPSTVIPPFYFMGAFLGAIAWTALVTSVRGPAEGGGQTRHDLGKLLFGFIIFWGYLLWAAYLPVWYGNLPDETGQLMARWSGDWKVVSIAVIATVLAFPFLFLLPERTKRGRTTLGIAATSILAGLLGERFLLVLPSLPLRADAASILLGAAVTLGVAGSFLISVGARLGRSSLAQAGGRPPGDGIPSRMPGGVRSHR
jgi:hypothetical protein